MEFGRSKLRTIQQSIKMNFNKLTILFIASIFLIQSCSEHPKEETDSISIIVKEMQGHQSAHYKITEKYYYSNSQDTSITSFEIWIVREKSKSTRAGYIWVDNNYRPYNMILHKGSLWLTIPPKKTTVLYPNYKESLIGKTDWIDIFLNPKRLQKQVLDTSNQTLISDIIYKGTNSTKISIAFPKNEKGSNTTITYIIDKSNSVPLWAKLEKESKERTYFNELTFSNFEFDKLNINSLKTKHQELIKTNPIKKQESNFKSAILKSMLHIGEQAPTFEGRFYSNGTLFRINDYIGEKIIILDFWYTHCPPCVLAIPALSELSSQYQDIIVLGLNSIDNQSRSQKSLKEFLDRRKINYDIIMTQAEVDMMYKVSRYPSLYIIDLDGKIAYAEVGYDEESFEELILKIDELLAK